MIKITDKMGCCGCSACAQICPQKCISMREDMEGFQYPVVDIEKCIECDLCKKACPIIRKADLYIGNDTDRPRAVGGWHKDETIRSDSSSGGAFTLFAEYVISCGGIVYGCALNSDLKAEHISVEKTDDLKKLRGSKYIQSDISGVYREIKDWLGQGRQVLFTGTPCQAAGLNSFLQRKYDNLYVVDFICQGVPSPKVFKSYIKHLEENLDDKIVSFKFRCKDKGWFTTGLQTGTMLETSRGTSRRIFPAFKDSYMNGFLNNIYLRPSCSSCEFKCLPKYYSDITIADFWGVKKVEPELYDGKGTSLILLNTEHGMKLFDAVKKDFYYREYDFNAAVRNNKCLIKSAEANPRRNSFFGDFAEKPFERVARKYLSVSSWAIDRGFEILWDTLENLLRKVIEDIFNIKCSETKWKTILQFFKFSVIGCTNVVVSYLINVTALFLLSPLQLPYDYIAANISAFSLGVLWSYYWNNRLVFALEPGRTRSSFRTLGKVYLSYAFTGIILNNALSTVWIHGLGIPKYIAPLCNIPVSAPINFLFNKLWAFSDK